MESRHASCWKRWTGVRALQVVSAKSKRRDTVRSMRPSSMSSPSFVVRVPSMASQVLTSWDICTEYNQCPRRGLISLCTCACFKVSLLCILRV